MKKLLEGNSIIKSFASGKERQIVLDNVSIEMEEGEFVAVMGSSGSGKSTLLYALSGMECVDEGEILFEGQNLCSMSDNALCDIRRQKMGFVFQQPTLLKNLNLLDNILLPQMRNNHKNAKSLAAKAKALMKQSGIEELAQRDITQASGGQLQRAGICRSLMNNPKILFADEPTGALNSKSSDEIMSLFSQIHKEGTSILLVTHDAKVAARAERIMFMQDGKIVSQLELDEFQANACLERAEKILAQTKRLGI